MRIVTIVLRFVCISQLSFFVVQEELEDEKLRREAELLVDKASELVDKAIDLEPNALFAKAETTKKSIDRVKKKLEDQVIHRLFY